MVWDGLSGGCKTGITLEECSQLAVFATHDRLKRNGGMVGQGWCSQVLACSELQFGALKEVAARKRQEALSRRAW